MLNIQDLKLLTDIAITAAREAGKFIADSIDKEIEVSHKESGNTRASQVVTEVDFKSQDIILSHLTPTRTEYQLGLLTEELPDDGSRFTQDCFWCVDPMDGTLCFTENRPGYAVSIALVSQQGESVIGVVYDPREQTLYHAIQEQGAFRNQEPWTLTSDAPPPYETIKGGGAVLNACWALEQAPASFTKKPKPQQGGGCLWDYAATTCIYQELKAWVSDRQGQPLNLNAKDSVYMNHCGVCYASHETVAREVLR